VGGSDYLSSSRKGYSELHRVINYKGQIYFDEALRLPECEHLFYEDGCLLMVTPIGVKMHGSDRWVWHPYSAELTGVERIAGTVYTFHDAQTLRWDTDNLRYEVVAPK
jgi:hypothetical protein